MAAGAAVLLVLIVIAAGLLPAYVESLRFQRALETVAQRAAGASEADDTIRVEAMNAAARLGLAVSLDQVRVKRAARRLEIEVLYVVPVKLPLYSVDLHFRPRASVR